MFGDLATGDFAGVPDILPDPRLLFCSLSIRRLQGSMFGDLATGDFAGVPDILPDPRLLFCSLPIRRLRGSIFGDLATEDFAGVPDILPDPRLLFCSLPIRRLQGSMFGDLATEDFACVPDILPGPRFAEANIGQYSTWCAWAFSPCRAIAIRNFRHGLPPENNIFLFYLCDCLVAHFSQLKLCIKPYDPPFNSEVQGPNAVFFVS